MEIRNVPLFQNLTPVEQARLLGRMDVLRYDRDAVIFRMNEPGDCMYVLTEGEVEVFVETPDGGKLTVGYIQEGDIFGEMSLLTDQLRSASTMAAGDVEVYRIEKEVFEESIAQNAAMSHFFTKLLCLRLERNNEQAGKTRSEQLQLALNVLQDIRDPLRKVFLHASDLPVIELELLERYFALPDLKQALMETDNRSERFELTEGGRLVFHPGFLQALGRLAETELDQEEHERFASAAVEDYLAKDMLPAAIQWYARHREWDKICRLLDRRPGQMTESESRRRELMDYLDLCPDAFLFQEEYFDILLQYIETKMLADPEAGYTRLAAGLESPAAAGFSEEQLSGLYAHMAELSHMLGDQQRAVESMRKAVHLLGAPEQMLAVSAIAAASDTLAGDPQEMAFSAARQNYEKAINMKQVSETASGRRFGKSRVFPLLVVLAAALVFVLSETAPPFAGLDREALVFLGLSVMAVLFWIANIIPDYLVSLLLCMSWVLLGLAEPELALSGFSNSIWLFIILVLLMGAAIASTGLMYRLSLYLFKVFPQTYKGQVLGLAITGIVINPFISSGMTKTLLSTPMAVNISESLGFRQRSEGSAGIVLSSFLLFTFLNPFFMTAGVSNFVALGLLQDESITFLRWMVYALPGLCLFVAGVLAAAFFAFRPERVRARATQHLINEQLSLLGKLKKEEIILLSVLAGVIVLQISESLHGIPGVWIFLLGIAVLVISRVLDRTSVRHSIDFSSLLHIGVAIGFSKVAAHLGIDQWFAAHLLPLLSPFTASPYIFLPVLVVLVFAVCFFLDAIPAIILMVVSLLPIFHQLHIDPWILMFIVLLTTGPFFLPYQSSVYMAAYQASEEKAFTHAQGRRMSLWYALIVLAVVAGSIPFWQWMGLL